MKRFDPSVFRVEPGKAAALDGRPTRDPEGVETDKSVGKKATLPELQERIGRQAQRLYAEERRSVLLVLQGIDASGKDGTIREALGSVSPSATRVAAFKVPSSTERAHDYLWRIHAACPSRGQIGVFNRSHYEDVLATRVLGLVDEATWRRRYRHIREFERLLVDEGTTVVKCFLHLSKERQRKRLQGRLDDPEKRWKFRRSDLDDRDRWEDYGVAFEDALTETSTAWAPWYVVPADRRWQRNLVVAGILAHVLEEMAPELPTGSEETEGILTVGH
jgi:PPK2 family polyphosphate:nucleotide phosphotransferase